MNKDERRDADGDVALEGGQREAQGALRGAKVLLALLELPSCVSAHDGEIGGRRRRNGGGSLVNRRWKFI